MQMLGFNGWISVAWNAATAYKDSDLGVPERILRRELGSEVPNLHWGTRPQGPMTIEI